jgi:hypothetical protein
MRAILEGAGVLYYLLANKIKAARSLYLLWFYYGYYILSFFSLRCMLLEELALRFFVKYL